MGGSPPTDFRVTRAAPGVRDLLRRHRTLMTVVGSVAVAALLVLVLAGRRDEFVEALFS